MSTAERLAFSINEERRGVHVLLWDEQDDLVRALLILLAALKDVVVHPLLVSPEQDRILALKKVVDTRCLLEEERETEPPSPDSPANRFWVLFLQQASSRIAGPWLNGWRRPLSEPPGTLLVIRHADFGSFQQDAPDLASFAGPRLHNASTMLSIVSEESSARLSAGLPAEIEGVLRELPGTLPTKKEIARWIEAVCSFDDRTGR
jgi:hypothetical protein